MQFRTTVVVVGNGLFGSAATRHIAERGFDVVNVGAPPQWPDIRPQTATSQPEGWPEHRVYSSHNDAARLTRPQDNDPLWADATHRAVSGYRELERSSGIDFFHDVGSLIVSRPGGDGENPDPLDALRSSPYAFDYYPPGDRSWVERWPQVEFPASHYVAFQPGPAGYIQPKRLIEAQNVLARRAGASFLPGTVRSVTPGGAWHRVTTANGEVIDADHVVICAGAFTNFNQLVPVPVPTRLKSEVVVLGEVSEEAAHALGRFPTVEYLLDSADLTEIYLVPPVQYEDGRFYIKMGADTRLDQWFPNHDGSGLGDIQQWFTTNTDDDYLPLFEPALRALWPTTEFLTVQTQPCIITYSPNHVPIVDDLGHGLYVATAGNGGGAKASDAGGENVADLVTSNLKMRTP